MALDADAWEDARELTDTLRRARTGSILNPDKAPVVRALLTRGRDPGDCSRAELWALAAQALQRAES